jgi:hypothetical protein
MKRPANMDDTPIKAITPTATRKNNRQVFLDSLLASFLRTRCCIIVRVIVTTTNIQQAKIRASGSAKSAKSRCSESEKTEKDPPPIGINEPTSHEIASADPNIGSA